MLSRYKISLFICAVFALQACTTTNPYTGEKQSSKATSGAAIGAVAGALLGLVGSKDKKKRKERMLKGAGIGAIAGGGIGYYMDVQEAKLRERLEGTGVSVTRDGDYITLNMPSNVTFDVDQSNLKASFKDVLGSVALVLKEYKSTMIEVAGHTDSSGSESYNQLLSQSRARSVSDELVRNNIQAIRIETVGFGEMKPIADNSTTQGREQNRRVELTLLPLEK